MVSFHGYTGWSWHSDDYVLGACGDRGGPFKVTPESHTQAAGPLLLCPSTLSFLSLGRESLRLDASPSLGTFPLTLTLS